MKNNLIKNSYKNLASVTKPFAYVLILVLFTLLLSDETFAAGNITNSEKFCNPNEPY
jgi:hypothetical protein